MKKIEAKIVADSTSNGHRITTFLLTYPRFIHGELMTHRVFSRNSASSRAIPFEKMVKSAQEDPFIPIAFQKDHKGMQGTEYLEGVELAQAKDNWIYASRQATLMSHVLNMQGVTKQLCNRILEPFMWHTVLVTATEFDNFFELRCPKYTSMHSPEVYYSKKDYCLASNIVQEDMTDIGWLLTSKSGAEIHIQALAEAMWDAMKESTPNHLNEGEWHIPFGDQMDRKKLEDIGCPVPFDYNPGRIEMARRAIATARCARLSYMTFDGEINYEKDVELHNMLLESKHLSPFEHCARVMSKIEYEQDYIRLEGYNKSYGWCNNFRGFIQYRFLVENV